MPAALHLTQEVLVLNSAPVKIPRNTNTRGLELYNHGPNAIWCAFTNSADAVSGKSRKIPPEGTWSIDASNTQDLWAVADTADQVTGAATIVSEVR